MRRKPTFEKLGQRNLLAGDVDDAYDPLDVNADGQVTASDAISVINWMRRNGSNSVANSYQARQRDVDDSGFVTALDALIVVNRLRVINEIDPSLPSAKLELAHDSAPGGTTNDDKITNDATLRGTIDWSSHDDSPSLAIRGVSALGYEKSIDITNIIENGVFELPSNVVVGRFHDYRRHEVYPAALELVAHSGDPYGEQTEVLARLSFVLDTTSPEVVLPRSIETSSSTMVFAVTDASGVTQSSLETLSIRQFDHAGKGVISQRTYETHAQSDGRTLVDFELARFSLADHNPYVDLQLDGVLEDVAGNTTTLPVRRTVDRVAHLPQPQRVGEFPFTPDLGAAFDSSRPAVRAGQVVYVELPHTDSLVYADIPVIEGKWRDGTVVEGIRQVTLRRDPRSPFGVYEFQIPDNAISGMVLDHYGNALFDLDVIPNNRLPNVWRRTWDLDRRIFGGIDIEAGGPRMRTLGTDDLSDPAIDQVVTREETLEWPIVQHGARAIYGFGTVQLAGDKGVSGPIEVLEASPDVSAIDQHVLNSGGDAFWLSAYQILTRVDQLTGQATAVVDVSALAPVAGVIAELHLVSLDSFGDRVHFASQQTSLEPATEVVAVRFTLPTEHPQWLLIDATEGTLIGTVDDSVDYHISDHDAESVYNPQRESLFQLWRDGSRWREISLKTGTVIAEGDLADSLPSEYTASVGPEFNSDLKGAIFWDDAAGVIRLLLRENGFVRYAQRLFDFDHSIEQFTPSTAIEYSEYPLENLTRAAFRNDWLYLLENSNRDPDTIRRERLVERVDHPAQGTPAIHQIVSVANDGEPTDPTIPSANMYQSIEVIGENLRPGMSLVFELDSRMFPTFRHYSQIHGSRLSVLRDVSEDGTRAIVSVPDSATSGMVRTRDQSGGVWLNIVPRITEPNSIRGDMPSRERSIIAYDITGLGSEPFAVLIDDKLISGCELPLPDVCDPIALPQATPLIERSLEVVTAAGRHRLEVPSPLESSPGEWEIESLSTHSHEFAKDYSYAGLSDEHQVGGSLVTVRVRPTDPNNTAPPPQRLTFLLQSGDGDPYFFDRRRAGATASFEYFVRLPIGFHGGSIMIEPPPNRALPADAGFPIKIAPTVVGASGDSQQPGSTILLAGINLGQAAFSIDGIDVVSEFAPPAEGLQLETLALTVPPEVTDGKLQIELDEVVATLDQLDPWWDELEMPVASVGTPLFDGLPSANHGQSFRYFVDCTPTDDYQCDADSWPPYRFRQQLIGRGSEAAGKSERPLSYSEQDGLEFETVASSAGPLMIFGDRTGNSLNLLPIVPKLNEVRSVLKYSSERRYDRETWLDLEIERFEYGFVFDVDWGDHHWQIDYNDTHVTYRPNVYLRSPTSYSPDPTSIIRHWWVGYGRLALESGVWLGPDNLETLPSEPIVISNGWGSHSWNPSEAEGVADLHASLVATSGTPADPSIPSVNAGQVLSAPQSIVDTGDTVVFARRTNANGESIPERASWTAAAVNVDEFEYYTAPYQVPDNAVTGMMRWGLLSPERYVQVIPEIYSRENTSDLTIHFRGVDFGDKVMIGQFEVPLSDEEVFAGSYTFSWDDPRVRGLTYDDIAKGISVAGVGGRSEIMQIPYASAILVNGVESPISSGLISSGPIIVRPGDTVTVVGGSLEPSTGASLYRLQTRSWTSIGIENLGVSEDQTQFSFRIGTAIRKGEAMEIDLGNGDATWSLLEHRIVAADR